MDTRREFVRLAGAEGANVAQLCRRFGISRKTGCEWLGREQAGEGLQDRSRRPGSSPGRVAEQTGGGRADAPRR